MACVSDTEYSEGGGDDEEEAARDATCARWVLTAAVDEGMPTEEFENRVCKAGVRPRLERTWHPLLKDLLTSTFEPDFRARPEFELLVEDLQTLVASISFNPASAYSGS